MEIIRLFLIKNLHCPKDFTFSHQKVIDLSLMLYCIAVLRMRIRIQYEFKSIQDRVVNGPNPTRIGAGSRVAAALPKFFLPR